MFPVSLKQEEGWDRVSQEMVNRTQRGGAGPSGLDLHELLFSKTRHLFKNCLQLFLVGLSVGARGPPVVAVSGSLLFIVVLRPLCVEASLVGDCGL